MLIANTSARVKQWEIDHADIAFGADFGVQDNKKLVVTGYMYNQLLNFDPTDVEQSLKIRALNSSDPTNPKYNASLVVDYENFFLHFSEDTEFIVPINNLWMDSWSSLRGNLWILG